ncbi:MAG: pyridoxamine 5'-phosphate oxidase [Magnetospiraceae bacterium]
MTFNETSDPLILFHDWMAEAEKTEPRDPNAMALATVGPDGMPSVRMVLLKGMDADGFVFYTNLGSRKAAELLTHPKAALCFHWKSLNRQIRVEGPVEQVSDTEADAYFASRPRSSRIGAWASKQSQPLQGRWELEKRVAEFGAKFAIGEVPRPEFWSGFRLRPLSVEFWVDRPFRLHDRIRYQHGPDGWTGTRLFP